MAATLAGAYKAYLESLVPSLGIPVFRDGKPPDLVVAKYLVVQDGIGYADDLAGDYGDELHPGTLREQVQFDLYQLARGMPAGATGRTPVLEDRVLPDRVHKALRSQRVRAFAPWRVYGATNVSGQRWPIADNVLRHTWTVTVLRDIERIPVP